MQFDMHLNTNKAYSTLLRNKLKRVSMASLTQPTPRITLHIMMSWFTPRLWEYRNKTKNIPVVVSGNLTNVWFMLPILVAHSDETERMAIKYFKIIFLKLLNQ